MNFIEWFITIVIILVILLWFVFSMFWFIVSASKEDSLKSLCLVDKFKAGNIFGKICIIMANLLLSPWIILYLSGEGTRLLFISIFTLIVKLGGWKEDDE